MISASLSGCLGNSEEEINGYNQTINENNDLINSLEEQVENLSSLLLVANSNIANLELEYSNLNYEFLLVFLNQYYFFP